MLQFFLIRFDFLLILLKSIQLKLELLLLQNNLLTLKFKLLLVDFFLFLYQFNLLLFSVIIYIYCLILVARKILYKGGLFVPIVTCFNLSALNIYLVPVLSLNFDSLLNIFNLLLAFCSKLWRFHLLELNSLDSFFEYFWLKNLWRCDSLVIYFWLRLAKLEASSPSFLAHEAWIPEISELWLTLGLVPRVEGCDIGLDRASAHMRLSSLTKSSLRLLLVKLRLVDFRKSLFIV